MAIKTFKCPIPSAREDLNLTRNNDFKPCSQATGARHTFHTDLYLVGGSLYSFLAKTHVKNSIILVKVF